jgi:O-antigen ligase
MPSLTTSPTLRQPHAPLAPSTAAPPAAPGYRVGFFLFLLVNAALFVRPADVVRDLQGWEIYQYLILACFAFSCPAVLASLSPSKLESRPIDLCVLGLLPALALSLLPRGNWAETGEGVFFFFKVLVYYLLLVSLVTTPKRLRIFLASLAACATLTVLLSILDHHKFGVDLPRAPIRDARGYLTIDPNRMYGPGIFSDPNDVCVLIVTALMIVLGRLADRRLGAGRWLWLIAVAIFGYGFYLTQSRGGLLALFGGLGAFIYLRFGWRNAILLGAVLFPGIVLLLGARQASVSLDAQTGQERLELWNAGLVMVRDNPAFGVGWGHYSEQAGHVAHNSFMHAFGELGLLGGTLFLGAFWLALWGLFRLSLSSVAQRGQRLPCTILDDDLRQVYPYLVGAIVAYCTGMISLSLNVLVPTYGILALTTAFLGMARTQPDRPPLKFEIALPLKLVFLSVLYLALTFVFLRLTYRP